MSLNLKSGIDLSNPCHQIFENCPIDPAYIHKLNMESTVVDMPAFICQNCIAITSALNEKKLRPAVELSMYVLSEIKTCSHEERAMIAPLVKVIHQFAINLLGICKEQKGMPSKELLLFIEQMTSILQQGVVCGSESPKLLGVLLHHHYEAINEALKMNGFADPILWRNT